MPNWVYNVLGAHDEHGIKFIFDNCINDDKVFTFNKLIPMPQILVKGCSPTTICSNFDNILILHLKRKGCLVVDMKR